MPGPAGVTQLDVAPAGQQRHRGMPWAAAREAAWRSVRPLPATRLALRDAVGRVTAADVHTPAPMPAVATAAMDGYALAGGGPWTRVAVVLAGRGMPAPLRDGTCVEIATGAPVPAGTTCVLPVEEAVRTGDQVTGAVDPGRHLRPVGEDAAAGELLVPAGQRLGPAALGLLAAAGQDRLAVRRRPGVDVLLTGDEVRTSGRPAAGFVRDAIGPMVAPMLEQWGAEVRRVELVPDTPDDALPSALATAGADLVLVCGATSVGPTDRLRPLLTDLGAASVVDSVSCRPGHPQLLAVLPDGRPVIGLPGNPFAALAAALTLAWSVIAGLTGRPLPELRAVPLAVPMEPDHHRTRLVPVRLCGSTAIPLQRSAPGSLRAAALADAAAVLEPQRPASAPVPLLPLL